jgi:GNAT superfamily N-acetyltransferase
MTDLHITIEGLSDEITDVYRRAKLMRVVGGPKALDWAFASNPTAFAVAREQERIIGISAYISNRMKLGQTSGCGLQAVDSFVDSSARGKGVFTALAKAYNEHADQTGAGLVWGFPNDNAAPAWFGKLNWIRQGQVPFLIKPLRAGFFLRKMRVPGDFPISLGRDQNLRAITHIGAWADGMWERFSGKVPCATIRDHQFLAHRLLQAPQAGSYRVVADEDGGSGALVATCEASKHGGQIAYLMEAMGGATLRGLLISELARLRDHGAELVLAWSYPWSPNYSALRSVGFMPLPERFRPIRIWFGTRAHKNGDHPADDVRNWYLSYLDSDTV